MRKLLLTALMFVLGLSVISAQASRDVYRAPKKSGFVNPKKKSKYTKYNKCKCGLLYKKGTKCHCLNKNPKPKKVKNHKKITKPKKIRKPKKCKTCKNVKKYRKPKVATKKVVKTGYGTCPRCKKHCIMHKHKCNKVKKAKKTKKPKVKKYRKPKVKKAKTPKVKNPKKRVVRKASVKNGACVKCGMPAKLCTCHGKPLAKKREVYKQSKAPKMPKKKTRKVKKVKKPKCKCKKCRPKKTKKVTRTKTRKKQKRHTHKKPVKGCPECGLAMSRCRCMV